MTHNLNKSPLPKRWSEIESSSITTTEINIYEMHGKTRHYYSFVTHFPIFFLCLHHIPSPLPSLSFTISFLTILYIFFSRTAGNLLYNFSMLLHFSSISFHSNGCFLQTFVLYRVLFPHSISFPFCYR